VPGVALQTGRVLGAVGVRVQRGVADVVGLAVDVDGDVLAGAGGLGGTVGGLSRAVGAGVARLTRRDGGAVLVDHQVAVGVHVTGGHGVPTAVAVGLLHHGGAVRVHLDDLVTGAVPVDVGDQHSGAVIALHH